MGEVIKGENYYSKILAFVLTLFLLLLSILAFCFWGKRDTNEGVVQLDDGWQVLVDDTVHEHVNLTSFTFDALGKGDTIILERTLPEQFFVHPTIEFTAYHCAIDVEIDNENIYTYGKDYAEKNQMVGMGYFHVPLPDNYEGKQLRIAFYVTEWNSMTNVETIRLGNVEDLIYNFIYINRLNIFVSNFFIVAGLIITLVAVYALQMKKRMWHLLWIGIFFLDMGLWCACSVKIMQLVCHNIRWNSLIEFLTLYMASIPILLLARNMNKTRQKCRAFLSVLLSINGIVLLAGCLLHITGIMHLPAILIVEHILIIINLSTCFILCILYSYSSGKVERMIFIGICMMALSAGLEISKYNIQRNGYLQGFPNVIPIGLLLFGLSLFAAYCTSYLDHIYEKAEKNVLLHHAYYDPLTEIHNRTYCEEVMARLSEEESEYAIINFDLNDLKKTNDTLGHTYGDRLIQGFANMLSQIFEEHGTVGRMGGDEFIVILTEIEKEKVDFLLNELAYLMEQESKVDEHLHYSAAWGYAFRNLDNNYSVEQVYKMADDRMYRRKREMKLERA